MGFNVRKFWKYILAVGLVALLSVSTVWLAPKKQPHLVFIGDSLTFGLGVAPENSMPSLCDRALRGEGYSYQVVNAGISGSNIRSAVPRIRDWIHKLNSIEVFVIALGGMDSKRTDYKNIEMELAAAVQAALENQSKVLLVAFHAPPEYLGHLHSERFARVYETVAKKYQVPLVPNQLAGIEGRPELYLADGDHPNEHGLQLMTGNIYPELKKLLTR